MHTHNLKGNAMICHQRTMSSQSHGRTWTGHINRAWRMYHIGTHGSQEHAAKARDMCVRCITE